MYKPPILALMNILRRMYEKARTPIPASLNVDLDCKSRTIPTPIVEQNELKDRNGKQLIMKVKC